MKFRYVAAARDVRHRDHGMALRSALCAFVAVLVTCAIWIATGWPEGSVAAMEAAVTCCLFASLDDPPPVMLTFANSAIIGAVGAAVYLFVMLPRHKLRKLGSMLRPPCCLRSDAAAAHGAACFGRRLARLDLDRNPVELCRRFRPVREFRHGRDRRHLGRGYCDTHNALG